MSTNISLSDLTRPEPSATSPIISPIILAGMLFERNGEKGFRYVEYDTAYGYSAIYIETFAHSKLKVGVYCAENETVEKLHQLGGLCGDLEDMSHLHLSAEGYRLICEEWFRDEITVLERIHLCWKKFQQD